MADTLRTLRPASPPDGYHASSSHARHASSSNGGPATSSNGHPASLAQFAREYRRVRRAEGWGSPDPAYYRALPYRDLTQRFERIWRIRARSFETFVERVLRPLERRLARRLSILDLGAGNGWLAYRLAQRGHHVVAIDLSLDVLDGLGAMRHYDTPCLPLQAEFDRLPLPDGVADLAVFNASLHYSSRYEASLREVLRVCRPEAVLAVLDTPFYHARASGRSMVLERERRFLRTHGFASNALAAEHFLTPSRLHELQRTLGIRWRVLQPKTTLRGRIGQQLMRLRLRRETARFPVIVGTRMSSPGIVGTRG